jgi:hypothetical protein
MIATALWTDDSFETGGGFIPAVVAEARAGVPGLGDHELDVGASTSGPFGPGQVGQFTWATGVWYPFTFTHDPSMPRQTWTVAATTVQATLTVAPAALDTLFLRAAAVPTGAQVDLDSLRISSAGLASPMQDLPFPGGGSGPAAITAAGPNTRRSLLVSGAALASGFVLTGRLRLSWTGAMPRRSLLAMQLKAGQAVSLPPIPAPSPAGVGEDLRPRRRMPVRYPLLLLPRLLAGYKPEWSTVLPEIFSTWNREP